MMLPVVVSQQITGDHFDSMISLIEAYEAKQFSPPGTTAQRLATKCAPNSR